MYEFSTIIRDIKIRKSLRGKFSLIITRYWKFGVYSESWSDESIHELKCFWATSPNKAFRIPARKHVRVT